MARTVKEIYDAIITEKQNQTVLNGLQPNIDDSQNLLEDLTTTSKVANWRLSFWTFAVAIWVHETLWDSFKTEVETIKNEALPGTAGWLQAEAFSFQLDDTLVLIDNKFQYAEIDEDAQIIKRCAIVEQANTVIVKVAKEDSSGNPEKLDDTAGSEIDQFTAYMKDYKRFAGVNMAVASYNADLLNIDYEIFYNPIVSQQNVIANVTAVIKTYLSELPFNGIIRLSSLEDAIQGAEGVVDFDRNDVQAKYESGAYQSIVRVYQPVAGYAKVDPAFPINTNFTWTPNV